jgi:hypothetical protein
MSGQWSIDCEKESPLTLCSAPDTSSSFTPLTEWISLGSLESNRTVHTALCRVFINRTKTRVREFKFFRRSFESNPAYEFSAPFDTRFD